MGFISSTLVSVIGGLLVSFLYSWKLSLVMTSFAPLLLLSGVFYNAALGSSTRRNLEEDAAKVYLSLTRIHIHYMDADWPPPGFMEVANKPGF